MNKAVHHNAVLHQSAPTRYFGTDGIRGTVGRAPITADVMLKIGWAAGRVLSRDHKARVLIGKDTRISGYMFEAALEAGFSAAGVDVMLLGPMPTPAIAYLTRTFRADAGIVISASHNAYHDNGIKFFSSKGTKLADQLEYEIEQEIAQPLVTVDSQYLGKAMRINDAPARYIEFCKSSVPNRFSLSGLKIAIDCANGATYHIAPSVFRELGAEVILIGVQPDGLNINREVGSTAISALQKTVLQQKADIGIAFDGDGDRVILIDSQGHEIDGDGILYLIARDRQQRGRLNGGVVMTVMSNFGLMQSFKALGIAYETVNVGDRYVIERLESKGWLLGGESSGHIVCRQIQTTGDGIIAALQVLEIMQRQQKSLDTLLQDYVRTPQTLLNVRIPQYLNRTQVLNHLQVQQVLIAYEKQLSEAGRILLRASGTESLIRILVEARDGIDTHSIAQDIARVIEKSIDQLMKTNQNG